MASCFWRHCRTDSHVDRNNIFPNIGKKKKAGRKMGWPFSMWMYPRWDRLRAVNSSSSACHSLPCPIRELLGKTCMGFYFLSWEIFILDTSQIYFCDLLNISALFPQQSRKHFLQTCFLPLSTPSDGDTSNQHYQPRVQLLGVSILGIPRCHSCSFSTQQVGNLPCLNGTMGKASCSTVIYNMAKLGVFSTKIYPRASTHTFQSF